MLHSRTIRWIELNMHWNLKIKRSPSLHSHDQACPVDYGPRPLKFRTRDYIRAAQIFSHLAHGARILRSRVIILVSAGFQLNASQQDYPLDQHALKSLKVVTELKWTKRIACSTVLNLETDRWPAQRRNCRRMPLGSSKMAKKKFRFLNF